MGNCLEKKDAASDGGGENINNPASGVATKDFSGGIDALFADLGSSIVSNVKSGPLQKLGGKGKSKWEMRTFELTNTSLSWSASKGAQGLSALEIEGAAVAGDVRGKPSLTVTAKVKGGKVYHLVAGSTQERDEWVNVITALAAGGLVDVNKQGQLLKLGGRGKDTWEARDFTASKSGLQWAAGKDSEQSSLIMNELASVRASPTDPAVGPIDFEISTTVKGGKVYYLRASTTQQRTEWLQALESVIGESNVSVIAMGDNGGDDGSASTLPEKTAEELAEEERATMEKRVRPIPHHLRHAVNIPHSHAPVALTRRPAKRKWRR
jgi:hypothetical protein